MNDDDIVKVWVSVAFISFVWALVSSIVSGNRKFWMEHFRAEAKRHMKRCGKRQDAVDRALRERNDLRKKLSKIKKYSS